MTSLKRSGTLQASIRHHTLTEGHQSPSPPTADEDYSDENQVRSYKEDSYYVRSPPPHQQQYQAASPTDRQSPWNTPGHEWRTPGSSINSIDDVQRALSALEIASNTNQMYQVNNNDDNFQAGQSAHPPRFNPGQPPPPQAPGMRNHNGNGNGGQSGRNLQPLVTDFDGRKTPLSQGNHGPVSASAYVPPIGHQQQQSQPSQRGVAGLVNNNDRALTVTGTTTWDQKERLLGGRTSNPNLQYMYDQQGRPDPSIPNVPPIPAQYLPQAAGQGPRLVTTPQFGQGQPGQGQIGNGNQTLQGFTTPIDVPSLIVSKGYNPANFDIRPNFVSRITFSH